jgi:glycerophosphoryl diester phosphodiesterase
MKHRKLTVAAAACLVLAPLGAGLAAPAVAAPRPSAGSASSLSFQEIKDQLENHSPSAKLLVAAHRGQWREAPENSLAAIDEAINDGAEIVETDVRLTRDGVPILMHDATVDRTTNGKGRVDEMTLAEIKKLNLREGLGSKVATVTPHTVPTLAEALSVVKNRAMLNLDKGWDYREQLLPVLVATGTVDHGIFKGSPTVAAAEEFMARDSRIQYMHIVDDATAGEAFAFKGRQPVAVEVVFDSAADPQAQPEYLKQLASQSRVWINSMWNSVAAGNTDEASLRTDPLLGWNNLVTNYRATVIQTDNVETLDYWRDGGPLKLWDRQPGANTVRVQAEDFLSGTENYGETDANKCLERTLRPSEDVDACNLDGANILQYIRDGEWVTYDVNITTPGLYTVSGRLSSDVEPAGTVGLDWGTGPREPVAIQNTTHNRNFECQELDQHYFNRGTHRFTVHFTAPDYVSLDYIQFDRIIS